MTDSTPPVRPAGSSPVLQNAEFAEELNSVGLSKDAAKAFKTALAKSGDGEDDVAAVLAALGITPPDHVVHYLEVYKALRHVLIGVARAVATSGGGLELTIDDSAPADLTITSEGTLIRLVVRGLDPDHKDPER